MAEDQVGWLILLCIAVVVALVVRRLLGMHTRGLADSAESLEGVQRSLVIAEENLELNRRRVTQGDEIIELLKSLNENMAHRTSKN